MDLKDCVCPPKVSPAVQKTFLRLATKTAGCVKLLSTRAHGYLLAVYGRFGQKQPPLQAPQLNRARYAKLAKALCHRILRQVVGSTVGDVVQLVRTLPRHS